MPAFAEQIRQITGQEVAHLEPMHGGCVSEVWLLTLSDGERLVVKRDDSAAGSLPIEAYMLDYLRRESTLPVPDVIFSDESLLLLDYLPGSNSFDDAAQRDAARHLAALHAVRGPAFGLERDTVIGGLPQSNTQRGSWLDFYAEQRLMHMAGQAEAAGRLSRQIVDRVERLASRLDEWLEEPSFPSLLHGDAWGGNILAQGDQVTGFLDPAIYYGDREIELAFTTLFGTFGRPFFEAYEALHPLHPGFQDTRRPLYHLYPLLVHLRLFGGSYVAGVDRVLTQFGC